MSQGYNAELQAIHIEKFNREKKMLHDVALTPELTRTPKAFRVE